MKRLIFTIIICVFSVFAVGWDGCSSKDRPVAELAEKTEMSENDSEQQAVTGQEEETNTEDEREVKPADKDEKVSSEENEAKTSDDERDRSSGEDRRSRRFSSDQRRQGGGFMEGVTPEMIEEFRRRRSDDPNRPESSREGRFGGFMGGFSPEMMDQFRPRRQQDPNETEQTDERDEEPLEALNLNNVEMRDVLQKISEWTGKPIIPATDEIMQLKVTIYCPEKLPRNQALSLLYDALRAKGVIAEQTEDRIFLKPSTQAKVGFVPTLSFEEPLARIEDKSQVVEKFFSLENYSPTRMAEIISPLVSDFGHVTALEGILAVAVIDTVENLQRIERIIKQVDVPQSEQVVERIFEIKQGDPAEIVQVLELILETSTQTSRQSGRRSDDRRRGDRSSQQQPQPQPQQGGPQQGGTSTATTPTTSVIVEKADIPIKLIPIPRQNWIIARASAEDMEKIADWIEKLDRKETVEPEQTVVQVKHVDASEVVEILKATLEGMPGTELRASVVVEALPQSKQVVIFGNAENRKTIERMIAEIDLPFEDIFETRSFKLKHADPDQIKENIEGLYGEDAQSSFSRFSPFGRFGRGGSTLSEEEKVVKVISYPTLKQVTVIASPRNMEKIAKQIEEEWDVPIDIEKDQYRIIALQNSDPVQMADLLTTLFSEDSGSSSSGRNTIRLFFSPFGSSSDSREKIVGSLYGLLTFEPVPDTKKIIVISKIPDAYDVIEKLVKELDSQEKAEVPKVITLKYADPEQLCDQLNAILNEAGTTATLQRSSRGLSEYDASQDSTASTSSQDTSSAGTITPWWTRQRSTTDEEMPTSNLIGKVRFIPVHRSKAILVLAPPEYLDDIRLMVEQLDQPGMQVMIKVIIVEVDHTNMTSLGVQLSSDTTGSVFGNLEENALTALTSMTNLETHGSLTIESTLNVNVLVDLLVKKANARVLNQPTLWTKDNQEAIFVKGQNIAFLQSDMTDTTGSAITQTFDYRDVGVTLRVRPNITPEKAVDMTINLTISDVSADIINTQRVINKLDTTTNLIVNDGQTIILGGILFQNDSVINRKVPLLGDIPIAGALFSHEETSQRNNELLAFVTPYVVDANSLDSIPAEVTTNEKLRESTDRMKRAVQKLNEVLPQSEFDAAVELEAIKEE